MVYYCIFWITKSSETLMRKLAVFEINIWQWNLTDKNMKSRTIVLHNFDVYIYIHCCELSG